MKIDYFSDLLINAHKEGTLMELNKIFPKELVNWEAETIKNPFNNSRVSTGNADVTSMNIPEILPSSITLLPIPGINAAVEVNPNASGPGGLKNLAPTNIIRFDGSRVPNPDQTENQNQNGQK